MHSRGHSLAILQLMDDYDDLFEPLLWYVKATSMAHVRCGPGWLPLIKGLLANLRLVAQEDGLKLRIQQIEEMYGQLRVSVDGGNTRVWDLLMRAEAASGQICEGCGAPSAVARRGGTLTTLCRVCLSAPDVPAHWREGEGDAELGKASDASLSRRTTTNQVGALLEALAGLDPATPVALEGPRECEHRVTSGVEIVRVASDPERFRDVVPPYSGPVYDNRLVALIRLEKVKP